MPDRLENAEAIVVERGDAVDHDVVQIRIKLGEKARGEVARHVVSQQSERGDIRSRRLGNRRLRRRNLAAIEKGIKVLERARHEFGAAPPVSVRASRAWPR